MKKFVSIFKKAENDVNDKKINSFHYTSVRKEKIQL